MEQKQKLSTDDHIRIQCYATLIYSCCHIPHSETLLFMFHSGPDPTNIFDKVYAWQEIRHVPILARHNNRSLNHSFLLLQAKR